jgi:DNA-binding PadR family transcriptional regulator
MYSKELLKGTLTTIILRLLAENGKMYGYEITSRIKEMSDGKILVKEGSLYPALHKLETDGFVIVEDVFIGKRIRRYYQLNEKGSQQALAQLTELQNFIDTIQQMITPKPGFAL